MSSNWPDGPELLNLPRHLSPEASRALDAEYDHLAASFLSNETSGEQRVNVFFGVVGAAIAGLGFAADAFSGDLSTLAVATTVAAVVLLGFGLATLRRVMERNLTTTDFLNGLRLIRAQRLVASPELLEAMPLLPGECHDERGKDSYGFGKAGLLELVALVNVVLAVIPAGLALSLAGVPGLGAIAGAVIVGAGAWIGQVAWARRVYAAPRKQNRGDAVAWWRDHLPPPAESFRAGVGLLVTRADGRVLAFERADVPGAWQLPQGGVDPGERLEAAAWRELAEETGLDATQVELATTIEPWLGYELPEADRSAKTGRGQVHRWHVFRLRPGAELPALPIGGAAEFRRRDWRTLDDVIRDAVEFRQPEYRALADQLRSPSPPAPPTP